jgi:AcrR family transcriptional regulator
MTAQARPYRSDLRNEQARATRRRIVDAACELFLERGYGPTTIDAIAERAGVGRKTIFTSAGGKAALLKLGFDWALAGDDEPVAIAERPQMQEMSKLADPATLLTTWIDMNTEIAQRVTPLYHVLVVAADTDPDAASLLATTDDQRAEGAHLIIERLRDLGGLRADLDLDEAADIADLLIDPAPYQRLVRTRRWTFDAYRAYTRRMAAAMLLPSAPPAPFADGH